VTLIFEVGTRFLDKTHHLDVVNICAKLFQNPSKAFYPSITGPITGPFTIQNCTFFSQSGRKKFTISKEIS
jgi:hypothetical protein